MKLNERKKKKNARNEKLVGYDHIRLPIDYRMNFLFKHCLVEEGSKKADADDTDADDGTAGRADDEL